MTGGFPSLAPEPGHGQVSLLPTEIWGHRLGRSTQQISAVTDPGGYTFVSPSLFAPDHPISFSVEIPGLVTSLWTTPPTLSPHTYLILDGPDIPTDGATTPLLEHDLPFRVSEKHGRLILITFLLITINPTQQHLRLIITQNQELPRDSFTP